MKKLTTYLFHTLTALALLFVMISFQNFESEDGDRLERSPSASAESSLD